MVQESDLLWEPGEAFKRDANITKFMDWLRERHGLSFDTYEALWQWSVEDIEFFWQCIWNYFEIESSTPYECVLKNHDMPGAEWFPGARVNFARHLFKQARPGEVAIQSFSEIRSPVQANWEEVLDQTQKLATRMRALGVKPGDRVAAFMPAIYETAIAFYATISIGAVWSCCSPDFGHSSVVDRFSQINPVLMFAADGYRYGAEDFDRRDEVGKLLEELPSVKHVITVPYLFADEGFAPTPDSLQWSVIQAEEPSVDPCVFEFEDVAFNHPLWIVYSSGTTGLPKPFVHGHGGILLETLKYSTFHINLKPTSKMFLFSTTGWIVWHNVVCSLATGSSAVFYDGNPAYPDVDTLWRICAETGATLFGTSPTFVSLMMKYGVVPKGRHDLSKLEGVMCTGSPATPEHFSWFYENIREDLWLTSLSGGTDVASAFVCGAPTLPVRAGEIQARALGVDVHSYDDDGNSVVDSLGELVVRQPMPSMPLYFWGDDGYKRYKESYFDTYPGVWRHGDYFIIKSHGGCFVRGRSDSTLNRFGVRIGTAEIYRTVESLDEINDSVIVNLDLPGGNFFMPLFVTLADGCEMSDALKKKISDKLRSYSPRHVPDQIYPVDAIPYTLTGKKMEVPLRKILLGMPLEKSVSRDSMANPESLDYFIRFSQETNYDQLS